MDLVFIARANDGLVLVETWESSSLQAGHTLKQQAKTLLKKIGSGPEKCSVDVSGGYCFHYARDDGIVYMVLANGVGEGRRDRLHGAGQRGRSGTGSSTWCLPTG